MTKERIPWKKFRKTSRKLRKILRRKGQMMTKERIRKNFWKASRKLKKMLSWRGYQRMMEERMPGQKKLRK
eukprot:g19116.t2